MLTAFGLLLVYFILVRLCYSRRNGTAFAFVFCISVCAGMLGAIWSGLQEGVDLNLHYIRPSDVQDLVAPLSGFLVPAVLTLLVLYLITLEYLLPGKRSDSDAPASCARCSYNLTGNVSGVCPECGRQINRDDSKR